MQAIGDTKTKELDNWRAKINLEEYYKTRDAALKAKTEKPIGTPGHPWTYVPKAGIDREYSAGFDVNQFAADQKLLQKVTTNKDFLDTNIDKSDKYKGKYFAGGLG